MDVDAVQVYRKLVDSLLGRAAQIKPDQHIEPPLTETLLGDAIWHVSGADEDTVKQLNQQTQLAAVEIAFRERFYRVLASTSIDDPDFIQIWNLLDIVSIFSDNEQCEPGLIFWLIEELLDSQTIEGCRKVFDYLESRRERNTTKHFKQKSLIILRSCNELLRRLSRAEDTVFCGRVFIFLFQSFPLGDKSSVNLRGEFHTENVTNFDEITEESAPEATEEDTAMIEAKEASAEDEAEEAASEEPPQIPKVVVSTSMDKKSETVDLNALYPVFWSLQSYFSAPTKMFDPERFTSFKAGLEATLSAFKNIKPDLEQGTARVSEEARKASKRKRSTDDAEIASSFNPKYLTSRDLFDLEISDTAFRRHVLVQALVLIDFMLSLTPKPKAQLSDLPNKSVLYGFILNEDDAKWAMRMRKRIEEYLQDGPGGKFYYRMVDTVLSRDKNWVRWKAEGCPLIERPSISVTDYLGAREHALKAYANKRLRPSPMGALDLKFLSDGESLANLERLKESDRYSVAPADSFMLSIMDDEMDMDMAQTKEEKDSVEQAKASKAWRILRLSAKTKLAAFEKVEDGKNLKILFESPSTADTTAQPGDDIANDSEATPQATESILQGSSQPSQDQGLAQGTEAREELVEDKNVVGDAKQEATGPEAEDRNEDTPIAPGASDDGPKESLAT